MLSIEKRLRQDGKPPPLTIDWIDEREARNLILVQTASLPLHPQVVSQILGPYFTFLEFIGDIQT